MKLSPSAVWKSALCTFALSILILLPVLEADGQVRIRQVVEDYEAKLEPVGDRGGSGTAEWERFKGGDTEFEVKVQGLEVPDGTELTLTLNGRSVGSFSVDSGRGELELESEEGHTVPEATEGDRAEVRRGDTVLLAGTFVPD